MRDLVPDMMLLFEGNMKIFGIYGTEMTDAGGGKVKSTAKTIRKDVTIELWIAHLTGRIGLGICPITDKSMVKFAAIDVDDYLISIEEVNQRVQKLKLPLVPFRTKSGGVHLFLFLESFYPADKVQGKMREWAGLLGFGNSEIFPKQTKVVADRGDMGSWINMPYQNCVETTRYAVNEQGEKLDFQQFLMWISRKIIDPKSLEAIKAQGSDILPGGPPCLNHLCSMGLPPGTRNNGLFNLAVYAHKAYGDDWKEHVHELNVKYLDPPLEMSEVMGIIKSVEKKEFSYMCKQPPIMNYCNMPKCRMCKHGIGVSGLGMPKFGSLTKLCTIPVIWFLEIEGGGRIELSTEQLQSPHKFQNRCMEILSIMPMLPKAVDWNEMIAQLLENVTVVEIPRDETPKGMLWHHLENFCTGRVQARNPDEILMGKPWTCDGIIYFRIVDFTNYLERLKFKMQLSEVSMHINEWQCGKKFWNLKGKGANTRTIKAKVFESQEEGFDVEELSKPEKVLS